jgi:hypothetical protein
MLDSAIKKGSRVMFVCDRRVLVDQFSRHLDKHGIEHGVYMAGHWRHRPDAHVQVASIQTMERMESWPKVDFIMVDEIHAVMRKSLKTFLTNHKEVRVIGLTATPFHPDIGKHFTNVTNVVTMKQLVDEGFLVPFRVFVAKEIDMTGVKVVAGEWQKDETEKRSLSIVGDVVADYIRISQEVFGGPRKTICFSAGVAHGESLVQKFQEHGINAVQISYKDTEEYKTEVLEEFAKPDTDIQIVISSDILTRGFDQTDVEHVIIAKPLRKAFSMHVQMVGRGARPHPGKEFCIATGQRVLTQRGLVPIEKVLLSDRLWDGESFVSHGGVVSKGVKDVITYAGLTATPDHLVKTKQGWRTLGECALEQIPIITTGLGWQAVRESEDLFTRGGAKGWIEKALRALRVRNLRAKVGDFIQQLDWRTHWGLPSLRTTQGCGAQGCSQPSCRTAAEMQESEQRPLQGLRRQRCGVQIRECSGGLFMGNGEPATTGEHQEVPTGPHRQQRTLRAGQSALVNSLVQLVSHAKAVLACATPRLSFAESGHSLCGSNAQELIQRRLDGRADTEEVRNAKQQAKREVWDILNSGPRNCFTCEGLLVHNCVIQDHANNWLRFADDWDNIYENGTKELDSDQDSKTRKEKTKEEKEASKCPKCSALWPKGSDTCTNCGHTRQRRSLMEEMPGVIEELAARAKKDDKQAFWAMCQYKVQIEGWNPGRAAHLYRDRFGTWPRGLADQPAMPDPKFEKFVKSRLIAYLKGKKRGIAA